MSLFVVVSSSIQVAEISFNKSTFENFSAQVILVTIVEIDEMFSQEDLAFNPLFLLPKNVARLR